MGDQPQKHGVPALLSFFCPGLGQLVKGEVGKGVGMFLGFWLGSCLIVPAVIVWLWSVVDAYNYNPPQALPQTQKVIHVHVQTEQETPPAQVETAPNFMKRKVLGALFFLAGAFILSPFFHGVIGTTDIPSLLGLFPTAFGAFMFWQAIREERRLREKEERERRLRIERQILLLAQEREGRVTAAEVATALDLPLEDAKQFLNEMASGGHASVKLTPSAVWVYQFFDVASPQEKALADEPWRTDQQAPQKTLRPAEEPPPPERQTN